MKKDVRYFLEFDEDDFRSDIENNRSLKSEPLSLKQKIFWLAFALFIFVSTVYCSITLKAIEKHQNEGSSVSTTYEELSTEKDISDKYKIRMYDFISNGNIVIYGKVNIPKDDLAAYTQNELSEMFSYICKNTGYDWITVNFSDGTGIICLPESKSTYLYGYTDNKGQLSELIGTIINTKDSYTYIPAEETTYNSETDTVNETDKNNDITNEELTEDTVYITASGTKYHISSCSYLSETSVSVSLSKAKEQGYLPCSRCIK